MKYYEVSESNLNELVESGAKFRRAEIVDKIFKKAKCIVVKSKSKTKPKPTPSKKKKVKKW